MTDLSIQGRAEQEILHELRSIQDDLQQRLEAAMAWWRVQLLHHDVAPLHQPEGTYSCAGHIEEKSPVRPLAQIELDAEIAAAIQYDEELVASPEMIAQITDNRMPADISKEEAHVGMVGCGRVAAAAHVCCWLLAAGCSYLFAAAHVLSSL